MTKEKTKEWQAHFRQMLLYLLKLNMMTQAELAKKIGITESTISKYINMERIPKITIVMDIAKALDIDIRLLLYKME